MRSIESSSGRGSSRPKRRIRRSIARVAPLLGGRRWAVIVIGLGATGAGIAEAALLALLAQIATVMAEGSDHAVASFGPIQIDGRISTFLLIAGVLATIRLGLQVLIARLPAQLSGHVQTYLRGQLFESFLAASWSEKARERDGQLQELMGGQTVQAGSAILQLASGLSALLMFIALAASAFLLSPIVAGAILATAILLFAALRPLSRRVRRRSAATSAASLAQASGIAESVRMSEEVHVFGTLAAERDRVQDLNDALERYFVRTRSLSALVPVLYQSAVIFLLIGGLAFLYVMSTAHLAALGAVVLLLVRASSYGQQLQSAYQGLGESVPYLDRLSQAIARYRSQTAPHGHRVVSKIKTLDFAGVGFEYQPGIRVLEDISFRIQAGEAVGIVGPTGAGKSTVLQVLLRLRDPSEGRYLINDLPAPDIEDEVWHGKIAYLPQEPHLLHATVRENIRFFRDWVSDEAIERAARLTHIHDDISSWPHGYGTIIGQRADAVSGGQRQRLCLARCLAGNPELLVLDEPTSSLDAQSEHLIKDSLDDLRGAVTLVLVAHRVTTMQLCDRVMVIRDGRMEAFASAPLLYDSNDFYRHAVDLAATGRA